MVLTADNGGVTLHVWVQPRAAKNEMAGVQGDALKIRITAPPVDGEANDALVRYIAKLFGLPRSSVNVVHGHSSRRKTLRISGIDEPTAKSTLGF